MSGLIDVGRLTLMPDVPQDASSSTAPTASPKVSGVNGHGVNGGVNGHSPADAHLSVSERLNQKRRQRGQHGIGQQGQAAQGQQGQAQGQQEQEQVADSPSPVVIVPLDLSLDLIYELTHNLKSYQPTRDSGSVDMTMYNYSTMVKTALERIQSQIPNRCGIAPIIAACLDWGIKGLGQYSAVQRLLQLKATFNERKGKHAHDSSEVKGRGGKSLYGARGLMLSTVFHSFPLSFSGSTRNVKIPTDIHSDFNEVLVTGLGLSASNAGMLAITYTLADMAATERGQELATSLVIEDDAVEMKSQIDKFLDDAQVRCELIEAGMKRWGMLTD